MRQKMRACIRPAIARGPRIAPDRDRRRYPRIHTCLQRDRDESPLAAGLRSSAPLCEDDQSRAQGVTVAGRASFRPPCSTHDSASAPATTKCSARPKFEFSSAGGIHTRASATWTWSISCCGDAAGASANAAKRMSSTVGSGPSVRRTATSGRDRSSIVPRGASSTIRSSLRTEQTRDCSSRMCSPAMKATEVTSSFSRSMSSCISFERRFQ